MKKYFDKVVEWDRKLARRFQDKFNLTDYQMLCVAFAKGFVIGCNFILTKHWQDRFSEC